MKYLKIMALLGVMLITHQLAVVASEIKSGESEVKSGESEVKSGESQSQGAAIGYEETVLDDDDNDKKKLIAEIQSFLSKEIPITGDQIESEEVPTIENQIESEKTKIASFLDALEPLNPTTQSATWGTNSEQMEQKTDTTNQTSSKSEDPNIIQELIAKLKERMEKLFTKPKANAGRSQQTRNLVEIDASKILKIEQDMKCVSQNYQDAEKKLENDFRVLWKQLEENSDIIQNKMLCVEWLIEYDQLTQIENSLLAKITSCLKSECKTLENAATLLYNTYNIGQYVVNEKVRLSDIYLLKTEVEEAYDALSKQILAEYLPNEDTKTDDHKAPTQGNNKEKSLMTPVTEHQPSTLPTPEQGYFNNKGVWIAAGAAAATLGLAAVGAAYAYPEQAQYVQDQVSNYTSSFFNPADNNLSDEPSPLLQKNIAAMRNDQAETQTTTNAPAQ